MCKLLQNEAEKENEKEKEKENSYRLLLFVYYIAFYIQKKHL